MKIIVITHHSFLSWTFLATHRHINEICIIPHYNEKKNYQKMSEIYLIYILLEDQ